MDSLDKKVFEVFSGRVVPKGATKKIKDSANVPTYVLEYLLGTYCTSDDEMEIAVQINGKTKAVVSLSAEASREEAIAAATMNPAKSIGVYGQAGSLTPGKRADVVLADQDLKLVKVI